MKKMMIRGKRLLAFSIATMLAFCAHATLTLSGTVLSSDVSGWKFNVTTGFTYNDGVETFTGLRVTSLKTTGSGVIDFRDEPFADGLKLIALGSGSAKLAVANARLKLPDTLVYISDQAFNGVALGGIEPLLPDSVRYIGAKAFYNTSLSGKMVIGGGGHPLDVSGSQIFYNNKIADVEFGTDVATIGANCFQNCTSLTNVTFRGDLGSIGANAFDSCSLLASITPELPKSLTYLGSKAFYNCKALKEIRIGGDKPFTFPSGVNYLYNAPITTATIGAGVTSLPTELFNTIAAGSYMTVIFEGYPGNPAAVFAKPPNAHTRRYIVPAENSDWNTYLENHSFVAWADVPTATKTAYTTAFGSDAETPTGVAMFQNEQYVIKRSSGPAQTHRLLIAVSPAGVMTDALTPQAGDYDDVSPLPLTCTVADGAAYNAAGTIAYECTGYEAGNWDGEAWVATGSGTAKSYVYDPQAAGYDRLTWLWEPVAYKVSASFPVALGNVTISGDEYETGLYAAGTDVTLTATAADPSGAPFVRWYGDVDAAQASNPTITVKADKVRTLIPYFAGSWTYDNGTISDGYWSFTATVSGTSLTLKSPKLISPTTVVCDLTKPILAGDVEYQAVTLANQCFRLLEGALTEVHLPKTITDIPGQCFERTGLRELHMEKVPTSIGSSAFGVISWTVAWYVPATAEWLEYVADGTLCKKWESMDDSEKSAWTVAGVEPAARSLVYPTCWIVLVELPPADYMLQIDVSPADLVGAVLDPQADQHALEAAQFPLTCTVADGAAYNAAGTVAYECTGYEISHWDGEAFVDATTGTGRSFDYTPQEKGLDKLTWLWEPVAYTLTVSYPAALGSVTISGDEYSTGLYNKGTDVTLTATAADATAPFVRWYGDVDAAQASNPTITVKADKVRTLIPYFRRSWTYDPVKNTMSDGYWSFTATASGTSLTLSGASGYAVVCDLTKPIFADEVKYQAVELANQCFRLRGALTELHLPETVTAIQDNCFDRTGLKELHMEKVPTFGNNVFAVITWPVAWYVPRTAEWEAYVADAAKCKTWKAMTDAERNAWTIPNVKPAAKSLIHPYCWIVYNEHPLILFLR